MKGDTLLLSSKYRKLVDIKVNRILEYLTKLINNSHKTVICIGGISGTMKSEVSYILQEELYKRKFSSYSISLDDYYTIHWDRRNELRKELGVKSIGIKEIDWTSINKIINAFYNDVEIDCIREINKYSKKIDFYYPLDFNDVNILIIEGLYALNCEEYDYGVYLDSTLDQTLKFRLERGKEEYTEFRRSVLKKEAIEVLSLKEKANLII